MKTLAELSSVLREQRKRLALNQKDMRMKIGMLQQQYQRIEAGSDLRVSTLMRVLEGMGLEMVLLPLDRVGEPAGDRVAQTDQIDYSERRDKSASLAVGEEASRSGAWDAVIGHLEDD
jgi:transcriptional regulator with XRE-family HTH domain